MMNIFKYEFGMYRKSILVWTLSIGALIVMFMAFYPTFGKDAEFMEKMLANYPEDMLKAFGMSGGLPLSSVTGYLAFAFAFTQICIAIQAANYGFSFLSIEEREFTADFLISKPVSRVQILSAKFGAACLALFVTSIFVWLSTLGAIELFRDGKEYDLNHVIVLLTSLIFFQLFFLTIGMVVSVLVKRIRSVLTFSLGLSFGTYILNAIGAIVGGSTLKYLSPFSHFEPGYILEHGKYDIGMVSISFIIIVASLVVTYVMYPKRDIHSL